MAGKRKLLVQVEKLLGGLLTEAQQQKPATFDEDGVEKTPASSSVTFGERLRLAEVVTQFELRRAKLEEDDTPSEVENIMESFHAGRAPTGSTSRKTRTPETDGIANGGRALPRYGANGPAGTG